MGTLKLLLDTCTFLWLAGAPEKISAPAAAALDDPQNIRYLSDASVWEIVLKYSARKIPLPQKPRLWLPKQTTFFHLQRAAIAPEALLLSSELRASHPDPFDRLLAAQALSESYEIVTPDPAFQKLGVRCIW